MNKKNIQSRVSQGGKPLDLNKFSWCEKTKTFSSNEDNLILDFSGVNNINFVTGSHCAFHTGYNCTFTTGSYCTFDTGSDCTFNTGFYCTFTTGSDCIFNTGFNSTFTTGSDCTFNTGEQCVIIRRDIFEVINIPHDSKIKLCPYGIEGYIYRPNGDSNWYMDVDGEAVRYIIVDGMLSKVVNQRGNLYKVINYGGDKETYLITDGDKWSHGDTLSEAKGSLIYKLGERDLSKYEGLDIDSVLSVGECIELYRLVTGACESGVRDYVDRVLGGKLDKEYRIGDVIDLTKGYYGNDKLYEFITAK